MSPANFSTNARAISNATLADRDLSLQLTTAARKALADEGYDPQFGARPLKRVIQHRLENPIATRILSGNFTPGDTIKADYKGKTFTFERSEAPTVPTPVS